MCFFRTDFAMKRIILMMIENSVEMLWLQHTQPGVIHTETHRDKDQHTDTDRLIDPQTDTNTANTSHTSTHPLKPRQTAYIGTHTHS